VGNRHDWLWLDNELENGQNWLWLSNELENLSFEVERWRE
jgi:hypothetical protein